MEDRIRTLIEYYSSELYYNRLAKQMLEEKKVSNKHDFASICWLDSKISTLDDIVVQLNNLLSYGK